MPDESTMLKVLLKERHLQEHRAFCREYDKIARSIDRELVGSYPSKATFYRWLSGDVRGLPYPDHCRILEEMLPGWTAHELFTRTTTSAFEGHRARRRAGPQEQGTGHFAGVTAVYASRSEFVHAVPPHVLFDSAGSLDAVGLSLNLLCQQYPDYKFRALLQRARVRILFLDPTGASIRQRNHEEGHAAGHLSAWTTANIDIVQRIRADLGPDSADNVEVRRYDETIRFNIMLIDGTTCVMQPYLPAARGLEAPTFVIRRDDAKSGVYEVFDRVFSDLWKGGMPL